MDETATATAQGTTAQTLHQDKIPVNDIAAFDDQSVLFFGVVPLVIIGILAVAAAAVYFIRRGKNWNELGEAMRIDEGDKPVSSDDSFNTKDIAEMEPTKPSQRIAELSRHSKPE